MRILIIKLTSMGDVLFSLSIIADIKERFPASKIDWVVDEEFSGLVEAHQFIDRVFHLPLRTLSRNKGFLAKVKDLRALIAAFLKIRKTQYQTVIDMQGVIKSGIVTFLSRGNEKWTYAKEHLESPRLHRFYTKFWEPTRDIPAVFQYRVFAGYVFGYAPDLSTTKFLFRDAEKPSARVKPQTKVALLVLFSSKETKQLDNEGMSTLVRLLTEHGFDIAMVAGSETEKSRSLEIARLSNCKIELIYRPIEQFSTFKLRIPLLSLCIGVDTGITHVSAAFGVPTIGIFSTSAPETYGPHHWAQHAQSLRADEPDLIYKIRSFLER